MKKTDTRAIVVTVIDDKMTENNMIDHPRQLLRMASLQDLEQIVERHPEVALLTNRRQRPLEKMDRLQQDPRI